MKVEMQKAGIKSQQELTNKLNEQDKDKGLKHYVQHVSTTLTGSAIYGSELKAMTRLFNGDESLINKDIIEDVRRDSTTYNRNIGKKLSEEYYKKEWLKENGEMEKK